MLSTQNQERSPKGLTGSSFLESPAGCGILEQVLSHQQDFKKLARQPHVDLNMWSYNAGTLAFLLELTANSNAQSRS